MNQEPARSLPPCENCGGPQVGGLDVVSQHGVGIHPTARTLWSRPLSGLNAVVCLNCGLTKLFTSHLAKLREEADKHPDDFSW